MTDYNSEEQELYPWIDNPTLSGKSYCDTDVLNQDLMHLKYCNKNKQTFLNPELIPVDGVITWTVTHTLNTQDLCVSVRRLSDNAQLFVEIVFTSVTQLDVKLNASETLAANTYKLTLIG